MKAASRLVCATKLFLLMLEFETTEEVSEVSLSYTTLLKGFSPTSRFWNANISP